MKACYLYPVCFASLCLILVLITTEFEDQTLKSENLAKNLSKRSATMDKKQDKRFLWNLLSGKKYRPTKISVPMRFPPHPHPHPPPPRHRMIPDRHPPIQRGPIHPPRMIQRPMVVLPGAARDPPRDLAQDSHPHDDSDSRRISNFWENFNNEPGAPDDADDSFGFAVQQQSNNVKEFEYTTEYHQESPGYTDELENIRNYLQNLYPSEEEGGKQELSTTYDDDPHDGAVHPDSTTTAGTPGTPGTEGRQVKAFWGPPIPASPAPPPPPAPKSAPIERPTPYSAPFNPPIPIPASEPSSRNYGGYSAAGSPSHYGVASHPHQSYAPSKSYLLDFTPLFLALVPICLALGAAAAFSLAGLHGSSSSGPTVITGPAAQQQQQQQQQAAAAAASTSSAASAAAASAFPFFNFPFFNSPFFYPIFIVNGTAGRRANRGRRARRGKKFSRVILPRF